MQTRYLSEVLVRSPRPSRRGFVHSVACRRCPCKHGSDALALVHSNGSAQPGTPCATPARPGRTVALPSRTVPCALPSAAAAWPACFGHRRRLRCRSHARP